MLIPVSEIDDRVILQTLIVLARRTRDRGEPSKWLAMIRLEDLKAQDSWLAELGG